MKSIMFPHCYIHKYLDVSRWENQQSDLPYSDSSNIDITVTNQNFIQGEIKRGI
jgi:hypothetical protein